MESIFEKAKFGTRFKTMGGDIAIYNTQCIGEDKGKTHCLLVDGCLKFNYCYDNGVNCYGDTDWDIDCCLDEPIDKKIDKESEVSARKAFRIINNNEYNSTLAESMGDVVLFNQVRTLYNIAENAFVQGAKWAFNVVEESRHKATRGGKK